MGRRPHVETYLSEFPELRAYPDSITLIAFEEFRQRLDYGEQPDAGEYAERYGVDTSDWGIPEITDPPATQVVRIESRVYGEVRLPSTPDASVSNTVGFADIKPTAGQFQDHDQSEPLVACRIPEPVIAFPEVGSDFHGFRLIAELGRGSFGRVYLAEQAELAGRLVAIKLTAELSRESQTLAQLQHTNIVPIYSVHHHAAVQAVCMPYFGATTLGDVLQQVRSSGRLPTSGIDLVSTVNDRRKATNIDSRRFPSNGYTDCAAEPPVETGTHSVTVKSTELLRKLGELSYSGAVLWITARLADGLAHAHERGIVHRDLKPANILLTDEGQPMLLDFNLAQDVSAEGAAAARIGGTLPYMAPEHLEAFGGGGKIDARSDLYSLGLILFELMTSRLPFRLPHGQISRGHISVVLPQMIQERRTAVPKVRDLNPDVSPAVEAIILKCLEPDPERRYQSAAELKEDIERHLVDLPLRFAPNPSLRERVRKWARRHPRLTSTTSTLCLAGCIFVAVGLAGLAHWDRQRDNLHQLARRQAGTDAVESLAQLEQHRQHQLALLYGYEPETAVLERIAAHSADALGRYEALHDPGWAEGPLVENLNPADRNRLMQVVAEVSLTWADALLLHSQRITDAEQQRAELDRAWELNGFAATCVTGDQLGPEYWVQRARLAQLQGRQDDATEFDRKAKELPLRTARDYFLRAGRHLRQIECNDAMPLLKEATRLDPNHLWAWFAQGNCQHQLSRYDSAVACYSTCLALTTPGTLDSFFPLLNRSKAYFALGRWSEAKADIDQAIEIAAAFPARSSGFELSLARFQRAAFREHAKDLAGAEADLTDALESPFHKIQILLARSRVRGLRADMAGARGDREEALSLPPRDEAAWNDRGLARIEQDPRGALADFEQALKINCRYYPSLQNKSHVLSERLGKSSESIAVLNQLLGMYPEFGEARIGRAVLLARLGKREEAHADAIQALARNPKAVTYYQAANVYALTAKIVPADAERVPVLMAFALLAGFGDEVIDADSDMDPVRNKAGFMDTLRIVREMRKEIGRDRR